MANQNKSTFSGKVEELIKSGRMMFNPGQAYIANRYTTEVTFFPQELATTYKDALKKTIHEAMEYNGDMRDYKAFDNLDNLQPGKKGKVYQTMGLYLYLADEVSRLPAGKTFLEAAREAQIDLKSDPEHGHAKLEKWFDKTLNLLQLDKHEHIQQLVNDWKEKGCFSVEGQLQYQDLDNKKNNCGAYVKLAELLCVPEEKFAQIANCIHRARGVRDDYKDKTEAEAFELTENAVKDALKFRELRDSGKKIIVPDKLQLSVDNGHQIREKELNELVQAYTDLEAVKDLMKPLSEDGKNFYRKVLTNFPEPMLNAIDKTNYRFAYTSDGNLMDTYPKDNPAGYSAESSNATRTSVGARLPRAKLALFSRGFGRDVDDPTLAAQVMAHEATHIVINDEAVMSNPKMYTLVNDAGMVLSKGKVSQLMEKIPHVFNELSDEAKEKLFSIKSKCFLKEYGHGEFSIAEVINTNSLIYIPQLDIDTDKKFTGYEEKARAEEVLANIHSLVNTEFSHNNRPTDNPFFANGGNDDEKLKPLHDIVRDIHHTVMLASEIINSQPEKVALRQTIKK